MYTSTTAYYKPVTSSLQGFCFSLVCFSIQNIANILYMVLYILHVYEKKVKCTLIHSSEFTELYVLYGRLQHSKQQSTNKYTIKMENTAVIQIYSLWLYSFHHKVSQKKNRNQKFTQQERIMLVYNIMHNERWFQCAFKSWDWEEVLE